MIEDLNSLNLKILDTEFTVKTDSSENNEKISRIAEYVNDELTDVKSNNPFTNHIRIAILGAMNITEKLFEAQKGIENVHIERDQMAEKIQIVENNLEKAESQIKESHQQKIALSEEKEHLQTKLDEHTELLNQYREHLKQEKLRNEEQVKRILDLQNQLFEKELELQKALVSDKRQAQTEATAKIK